MIFKYLLGMSRIRYIVIFCTGVFFSACTAGLLELEFPTQPEQIVINGFVRDGHSRLELSYALDPNDTIFYSERPWVTSADVVLLNNSGERFVFNEESPGIYLSNQKLNSQDHFRLEVNHPGLAKAVMVNNLILPDQLEGLRVSELGVESSDSEFIINRVRFIAEVEFVNSDAGAELLVIPTMIGGRDFRFVGVESLLSEDLIDACGIYEERYFAVPSGCFRGQEKTTIQFACHFEVYDSPADGLFGRLPDSIFFDVLNVQPIVNEHLRALVNSGDAFDQVFVIPNLYVSNVENGLGLVSGATGQRFEFRVR